MSKTFGRQHRITQRSEFDQIYQSGQRVQNELFRLYFIKCDADDTKIGISASKRVGNAVVRNRLKRLIRDWFRRHKSQLAGMAFVVQVKTSIVQPEQSDIDESLNRLIQSAKGR